MKKLATTAVTLALAAMILTTACQSDRPQTTPQAPQSQPLRSMQEWERCIVGKVAKPHHVNYWQARKDLIWLRCIQHLPEDDVDRATKIMRALDPPVQE